MLLGIILGTQLQGGKSSNHTFLNGISYCVFLGCTYLSQDYRKKTGKLQHYMSKLICKYN